MDGEMVLSSCARPLSDSDAGDAMPWGRRQDMKQWMALS